MRASPGEDSVELLAMSLKSRYELHHRWSSNTAMLEAEVTSLDGTVEAWLKKRIRGIDESANGCEQPANKMQRCKTNYVVG